MGWPNFCRVLYGAAVGSLIWLNVALNRGMDLGNFTASGSAPPGFITKSAVVFGGLVVLAFPVFWTRSLFAWLFIGIWRLLRWLFSWRMIRRYLYGLAGLALVVALFYSEEDWRGKRDWEQFKRAAETKGERFDYASFVPPIVPDNQNFAFSPLVSNSCLNHMVRNEQGIEEETTNGGPRLGIRINAPYDWKPWPTNDFQGNWQCGRRIDLRVFQTYYRAPGDSNWQTKQNANRYRGRFQRGGGYQASLPDDMPKQVATNEFPVAPQPQSPPADVLLALSKYDSAIEQLRQSSRRPFFQFPLRSLPEDTFGFPAPYLAPIEDCVPVLRLRAVAELEDGQAEKASEEIKLILYLAHIDRHEPWREFWRQGWRITKVNDALQPVWQGLVDQKWSDIQLTVLEKELANFDFLSDYDYFVRSCRAEKIEEIDYFGRRSFHDFWAQLNKSPRERVFNRDTLLDFMPRGWFFQNDVAVSQVSQQSLRTGAEVEKRILSAEVEKRCHEAMAHIRQHLSLWNMVAGYMYYEREVQNLAFMQFSLDRARVVCALERHRLAAGEYPATLDALAPRFIEKLPRDIINGQPLHYRRTDNGRFLLYSVGWNGTDDGGIIVRQKNWVNADLDKDHGDWVWPNPEK